MASSIHPDTGDLIPWPARISAFVPTNVPIILGMLTSRTMATTFFWQWVNQTYNACLNIGNRNASSEQTTEQILKAYVVGTCAAVGVACSLRALTPFVTRGRETGAIATLAPFFIGYAAVASSSSINAYMMRASELDNGINVKDDTTGESFGKSKIAAWQGV